MIKKELILLRHGKSDWSADCSDFDRPLKKRGKRGAQRIGAYLHDSGVRPDLVISSPAKRAKQTAKQCVKAMGLSADSIVYSKHLYESNVFTLFNSIKQQSADISSILLVGHNPSLADLLSYLSDHILLAGNDGKLLPTATMARMSFNATSWQVIEPRSGTINEIKRAKELGYLFPAKIGGELVLRKRPNYYYCQSAVIPFRATETGVEVLLIGSNGKKHWIVPKGIVEPGLSSKDSAEKEAYEEAGIEGFVAPAKLGTATIEKWGNNCSVEIFAMRVNRVLPEEHWPESHRGRQWLAIDAAVEVIENKYLVPFILALNTSR